MTLGTDMRPRHVVGMIGPAPDAAFIYYQFYQTFPPNSLLVHSSLKLDGFSAASVDRALANFWNCFDFLHGFRVEDVVFGGVPMSSFAGRPRILELLSEARRRTTVPVSSDFEDAIDAVHELGLARVAIAAKWAPELMDATAAYLAHAGVQVAGSTGDAHSFDRVQSLNVDDSVDVALGLGRRALQATPEADGLLLLGGGWLVMHAVPILEAEFGKPVISNAAAIYWGALRRLGLTPAARGLGTLMDGLTSG